MHIFASGLKWSKSIKYQKVEKKSEKVPANCTVVQYGTWVNVLSYSPPVLWITRSQQFYMQAISFPTVTKVFTKVDWAKGQWDVVIWLKYNFFFLMISSVHPHCIGVSSKDTYVKPGQIKPICMAQHHCS